MNKTQTSTTAKGIAALRAIESERLSDERICYDPLARKLTTDRYYLVSKLFSAYGERKAPGTQGYIVCRCRYFDDYIKQCISNGVKQIVILGAGLDSRAYRKEMIPSDITVFEVDQPATQKAKVKRVKEIIGNVSPNVVYVPIDFMDETLDKLVAFGYNKDKKVLFVWEGVTYYLSASAVDQTLDWISSNSTSNSYIIFDYIYTSALNASNKRGEIKRMQRYSRFTGEGLVFGIEKGTIPEYMRQRGFTNIIDADNIKLQHLYCIGKNAGRIVADTYAIVSAEVKGK